MTAVADRASALVLTVAGRPQPAGSKRAFAHRHTGRMVVMDDAKSSAAWKRDVAVAARATLAQLGMGGTLLEGPLGLDVTFVLTRPRRHYRTGRNLKELRDVAPAFPIVRPDTTKLVRAVEDALTGVVWVDDAQVVEQTARKVYGDPERCEIAVHAIEDPLARRLPGGAT